jgi:hypothetical protein
MLTADCILLPFIPHYCIPQHFLHLAVVLGRLRFAVPS